MYKAYCKYKDASAYKVVIEYRQYFSFYEKSTSNKN